MMDENAHKAIFTPGPWTINIHDMPETIWIDAPGCSGLCKIEGNIDVGVADAETVTSVDYANAHLIAAAPCMFLAIQAIVDGADQGAISQDQLTWLRSILFRAAAGSLTITTFEG